MASNFKDDDFYTFRSIDYVIWDRQDEILAQKEDEDNEDETEYRDWQDELDEALTDAAWYLYNQYGEGYDDGATIGLHIAIGEAVIEGFKKFFNINLKGNAEKIGEEVYINDESWTGEGIELSLDGAVLAEWFCEQKYPDLVKTDFTGDIAEYFAEGDSGKLWIEAVYTVLKTEMDFEFDGEEFEEENVSIHGEAVLYKDIIEEIINAIENWKDEIEDIDPKDYK